MALVGPVAAVPRKTVPATKAPAVPKLMQSCDAHKFETIVDTIVNGEPRKSKVKLCGIEGQNDAAWIETLRDAVRKLTANKTMPPPQREQIVTAINAEIGRLSIIAAPVRANGTMIANSAPATPLSRDYPALPPLPAEPQTLAANPPPPFIAAEPALSPAPAPAGSSPVRVPAVIVPRLDFTCVTPGELGSDAPCTDFQRETILTVHTRSNVPAGSALRFIRNGQARVDIDLAPLASAKTMQMTLPRQVCAGFGAGRIELQVIVNDSVGSTDGPYTLRCY